MIGNQCRGGEKRRSILIDGQKQDVRVAFEPDLYRLIAASKLPAAPRFEKWMFEDVLPALRQEYWSAEFGSADEDAGSDEAALRRRAASIIAADLRVCRLIRKSKPGDAKAAVENAFEATGIEYHWCLPFSKAAEAEEADGIRSFTDECCDFGREHQVSSEDLYTAYCNWFQGTRELGRNTFYARLRKAFKQLRKGRIMVGDQRLCGFRGIGLKLDKEPTATENQSQPPLFQHDEADETA